MRNFLSYVLVGVLVVVLLDLVAPPVGLGLGSAAWPSVGGGTPPQVVDRTHKSDRLQVPRANGRRLAPSGAPVPVGCDAVFSTLSKEKQANFPGRCLA
jgi:hypothetical protein